MKRPLVEGPIPLEDYEAALPLPARMIQPKMVVRLLYRTLVGDAMRRPHAHTTLVEVDFVAQLQQEPPEYEVAVHKVTADCITKIDEAPATLRLDEQGVAVGTTDLRLGGVAVTDCFLRESETTQLNLEADLLALEDRLKKLQGDVGDITPEV